MAYSHHDIQTCSKCNRCQHHRTQAKTARNEQTGGRTNPVQSSPVQSSPNVKSRKVGRWGSTERYPSDADTRIALRKMDAWIAGGYEGTSANERQNAWVALTHDEAGSGWVKWGANRQSSQGSFTTYRGSATPKGESEAKASTSAIIKCNPDSGGEWALGSGEDGSMGEADGGQQMTRGVDDELKVQNATHRIVDRPADKWKDFSGVKE
ncbi:hypothetical protein BDN71DRAFT_1434412 [Pleurotus eryngii]|uniref:Uncharacterized protein n=1 Tax=Pleurotus eryngii TaxID=5323 RepID=A0A9P5ZQZ4_PLEER|nr:hypothetical protein BDN71DRAFT_1434412 [Pleurotus eryngii]